MGGIGSFIAGGAFMISIGLMAIALALVYIGYQIKKHNQILEEKSK